MPPLSDAGERLTLPLLQAQIRACTRCQSAGFIPEARPLTLGGPDARFMVIGQAPSRTDHLTNNFYCGPAGKRLRDWFIAAGFSDDDFRTSVYLAAITKCFPGRLPGSSKDRLPSKTEQALCRSWLDQEIALLQPRVIVLFGSLVIQTFLSREPLKELVGQVFAREDRLYLPLPHSSGASTWLNSTENRALLAEAIECLRETRQNLLKG